MRRGGAEWDGPVDRSEAVRMPHLYRGRAAAVVFFFIVLLGEGVGGRSGITPPIIVEDRQLAARAAHVVKMMRMLPYMQWWGQATVAKAEAARGQTTINQKVAGKIFKIVLGLIDILIIVKENSGIHRGSGCGGRKRGQRFAAAATVTIAVAAKSGNGGGRQRWR